MSAHFSCRQQTIFSTPFRFKRGLNEGWDMMNSRFLADPEPAVEKVSDRDRPVELIPCVDTGQNQCNLQHTCPSPPQPGTAFKASMKRSPSPPESSGPVQRVRKKHLQSESPADDEADSADGSNSPGSTLTTTPQSVNSIKTTNDHPATEDSIQTTIHPPAEVEEMETEQIGLLPTVKLLPGEWKRLELIYYSPNTNTLIFPDLSDKKLSIPLILQRINSLRFTSVHFSDSSIKNVFLIQYKNMLKSLKSEEEKKKIQKKNQFAFYFLRKKDGSFTEIKVYFPTEGGKKHSEDFIVEVIQHLIINETITEYTELWIYTENSPCMGRKDAVPCMIQLTTLSDKLGRFYQIKTFINFSKPYGPSGPIDKILPAHTYRKCSYSSCSADSTDIQYSAHNHQPPLATGTEGPLPASRSNQSLSLSTNNDQYSSSQHKSTKTNFFKFRRKRCDSLPVNTPNKTHFSGHFTVDRLTQNPSTFLTENDHQSRFLQKNFKFKRSVSLLAHKEAVSSHIKAINLHNYESDPHTLDKLAQTYDFNHVLQLARNTFISEDDRELRFLMKYSSRFKTHNLISLAKENIPKDKWKILFDIIHTFKPACPKTPHTFNEYEKMGEETSVECEKSLRAILGESVDQSGADSICEMFRSEFLSWWATNLQQSYSTFLNGRLSEGFNRKAVQLFIHNIRCLPYKPIIVCIDDITDYMSIECTADITGSESVTVPIKPSILRV